MADVKQYIFFDFEMLCDDRGMPFDKMEAIRLGAVKYDLKNNQITCFDRYIKPMNRTPLSPFCTELTGIKDCDLNFARDFKEVFTDFLTWVGGVKKSRFFSWSPSDILRLKIDTNLHNIPLQTINKIESRYVDFQAIFTKRVTKTNYSVENALHLYGLNLLGEKHNPMCDAYNTLRVYLCFLNERLITDLIMVKHFISEDISKQIKEINVYILEQFNLDVKNFFVQFNDVQRLKDVHKKMKAMKRLVQKYDNIQFNRSKIFSKNLIAQVQHLNHFYNEFIVSYEEHLQYYSKTMILDEELIKPLKQFILK